MAVACDAYARRVPSVAVVDAGTETIHRGLRARAALRAAGAKVNAPASPGNGAIGLRVLGLDPLPILRERGIIPEQDLR